MKSKMVYNGNFLTEMGHKDLLVWWEYEGPGFPDPKAKIYAHHMTSYFRPKGEEEDLNYGEEVPLELIGYAQTEELGVAVVQCKTPSKNEVKHITVWTAQGVKPSKSNEVLEQDYVKFEWPVYSFQSVTGYWDGKRAVLPGWDEPSEKKKRQLESLKQESERMDTLINNFLSAMFV